MKTRKKLIEVALPLKAINTASAREKSIRHGHPSTLHIWWSRKPLAAARAVIFSQMVDDPSSCPEEYPTEEAQEKERQRLFQLIEELVLWDNTTNEDVLNQARDEIWKSWRRTCADNRDHPRAAELFNPDKLPAFHDPFAGGGSLPLEAQRLGLEAYASDLNPVAVLICKAMIEIPPKFAGRPPVNPEARSQPRLLDQSWKGTRGLAEDVRYYGKWMRDEAEKRIGHLYPKVEITAEMAEDRDDLKPLVGQKLTVIAWLWVRTVTSPNPAFATVHVPLAPKFWLSSRPGKEAYVQPMLDGDGYRFVVKVGKPAEVEMANMGTAAGKRKAFLCLLSGTPIDYGHIRVEGQSGRMSSRLLALVADGQHGRVYLSPSAEHEKIAKNTQPGWSPGVKLPFNPRDFKTPNYGLDSFADLFTPRQLVALTTFADLVREARDRVRHHALAAGWDDDHRGLEVGGTGASAYADAVAVYLAFAVDRLAMTGNSLVRWNAVGQKAQHCFGRQALPMIWDYAEPNPLAFATGSASAAVFYSCDPLNWMVSRSSGWAYQADAATASCSSQRLVSTDPPYYDNVGYADLSDFFYVWLRHSLRSVFPDLFSTVSVPKADELVATPYRHNNKEEAETFFLEGMTKAIRQLAEQAHPAFPVTIYYAFRQAEMHGDGAASTGWDTFLSAVIRSGFSIAGTWPIRTEMKTRQVAMGTNALASSVVLVCRPLRSNPPVTTRRDFLDMLKSALPIALKKMQHANIAPVDLAQAAIGPGMAVFTRYSKVLDAAGNPVTVRDALMLINRVLDEVLAEQEGDYDSATRWALAWYEQVGFIEAEFGVAETLSKAKNTSVSGMVDAGIITAKAGGVRLLKPTELPADWDPETDNRLTAWEMVHHLVRALEAGSEPAAAALMSKLGSKADVARDLAYRLYAVAERKNRASEALWYNSLVQSWPDIVALATRADRSRERQATFLDSEKTEEEGVE